MPEHASRAAALYDQFEDEPRVADWGGDELFTRMPRPRAVDDAPPPRFRPYLAASDPGAMESAPSAGDRSSAIESAPSAGDRSSASAATERSGERALALVEQRAEALDEPVAAEDHGRAARSGEHAMAERAERLGLSVVESSHRWDESGAMIEPEPAGRRTKVITGHPGGAPRLRPLPTVPAERRRPSPTPAEWVGARPERIVAWAFVLGLILILVAIFTG